MRWRVEYEEAFVAWLEQQRPSLEEVAAVVRWLGERKSLGPPAGSVPSPDLERPEDRIGNVRDAKVDVLFLAYESETDAVMLIRDFSSYGGPAGNL